MKTETVINTRQNVASIQPEEGNPHIAGKLTVFTAAKPDLLSNIPC